MSLILSEDHFYTEMQPVSFTGWGCGDCAELGGPGSPTPVECDGCVIWEVIKEKYGGSCPACKSMWKSEECAKLCAECVYNKGVG